MAAQSPFVATAPEIIVEARSFAQGLASVQLWLQDGEGPHMWEFYYSSPCQGWAEEIPSPSMPMANRLLWIRDPKNRFQARCHEIPNLVIQA